LTEALTVAWAILELIILLPQPPNYWDCSVYHHAWLHLSVFKDKNYIFRAGRVAQVVEQLPSKHEALTSNPSTAKKKNYYF
jgi:hypothetical protein